MNAVKKTMLVTPEQLSAVTAFIAEKTTVKGDFEADTDSDVGLKVDGTVQGSIRVPNKGGLVHVGPTGHVKGAEIVADYVFVEGQVDGKIVARKGIELADSAFVRGEIQYGSGLFTHGLAKVKGSVNYSGPDA